MRVRALIGVFATAAVALGLTGCGGNNTADTTSAGGTPPPSSVEQRPIAHNQADLSFAQEMIPHHAEAIQMAQSASDRAQSAQVKEFASRIEQAQGPEIETMTSWLRTWNAQVPPTGESSGGHGGGTGAGGGMGTEQMQQLEQTTGAEFDRLFLQMMIKHHEGAIEMARAELDSGRSPEVKQLAQQIIDAQQAEIEEMQVLLPRG
ncbi:MAG: DUF305 domain-containing protein [Pseudonocardiaceae bacterium]